MGFVKTNEGLVRRFNFDGADGDLPSPWENWGGSSAAGQVSNRFRAPRSGSVGSRPGARQNDSIKASGVLFTQAEFQFSDGTSLSGMQFGHFSPSARTGYGLHADSSETGLNRWTSNSPVGIDDVQLAARAANTLHVIQLYTAPGHQRGYASHDSGAHTVEAADETHDAVNKVPSMHRNNNLSDADHIQAERHLWMNGRTLRVTGPPSAWSLRLIRADDTTVDEVAAVAGVAEMNCELADPTAFVEMVPFDGWKAVQIIVAAAVVEEIEEPIYPGSQYVYSTGAAGPGTEAPGVDPERPVDALPEGAVLLDVDPLDQTGRWLDRAGSAWNFTIRGWERRSADQERLEAHVLQSTNRRWVPGMMVEPQTAAQKITQPFDVSTSAWDKDAGLSTQRAASRFDGETAALVMSDGSADQAVRSTGGALTGVFTANPETACFILQMLESTFETDCAIWDLDLDAAVLHVRLNTATEELELVAGSGSYHAYKRKRGSQLGTDLWIVLLTAEGTPGNDRAAFWWPTTAEESDPGGGIPHYIGYEEADAASSPLSPGDTLSEFAATSNGPPPRQSGWLFHFMMLRSPEDAWLWRIGADDACFGVRLTAAGTIESVHKQGASEVVSSVHGLDWNLGDELYGIASLYSEGQVLLSLSLRYEDIEHGAGSAGLALPEDWAAEASGIEFDRMITYGRALLVRLIAVKMEAMAALPGFATPTYLPLWELRRLALRHSPLEDVV